MAMQFLGKDLTSTELQLFDQATDQSSLQLVQSWSWAPTGQNINFLQQKYSKPTLAGLTVDRNTSTAAPIYEKEK